MFDILLPYYKKFGYLDLQDNVSGQTALHYAFALESEEMIEKLVLTGANPNIRDYSGESVMDDKL